MTEDKGKFKNKSSKKKQQLFLKKLVFFIILICFGYFGFKYWNVEQKEIKRARQEIEVFDNIEGEVFDLHDEYGSDSDYFDNDSNALKDNGLAKKKDFGFIYKSLIKNQLQLKELKAEVKVLKDEVLKYKSHEKIGKIVFAYVQLRDDIFEGKDYSNELKSFELIIASDEILRSKVKALKQILPDFLIQQDLFVKFKAIIPDLITSKGSESDLSMVAKIRHNIAKLIVIRRIDGENLQNIDGAIVTIEEYLKRKNYKKALDVIISLEDNHKKVIKEFFHSLKASFEVQKIDQEILNYLKTLT